LTGFRVEFTRRASKDLERAPPWLVRRVDELVSTLREDPVPRVGLDVRELLGMSGVYRVRVGDYRIVYLVNDSAGVVTVLRVTSRGDAYAD
jgi:mRNA interferase RelE/StbE